MIDFKGIENLAALPVAVVMGYFMYLISSRVTNQVIKLATNHIEHNTMALNDLREANTLLRIAVGELTTWLRLTRQEEIQRARDTRVKGQDAPYC